MIAPRASAAAPASSEGFLAKCLRVSRMTAVRLSILYFVVFTLFSLFLVVLVSHDAARIMSAQIHEAIDTDVAALEEQYHAGGLVRLLVTLDELGRRPDAGLFYVVDTSGNPIAGNVAELPPGAIAGADEDPRPLDYTRFENGSEVQRFALVRTIVLDNGFRVLVGRDVGERERFRMVIRKAFRAIAVVMVLLGGATWLFVSRRVLKRIDQVSATSRRLVAGDLSGRLAVTGSGDEFDRLAVSLNTMLDRIGELMKGLKEVSDNVAHDLKTPLTRLRNRAEAALSGEPSAERYREALEATIDESDGLIRTFDALLTIARLEAGSGGGDTSPLDLAEVVDEVAELWEPVAEEEDATLTVATEPGLRVAGRRELLAQTLINLLDNALKHGRAEGRPSVIALTLARDGTRARITVADNGDGIAEADRARVFERFTRLEASRSTPGSGLGLALVAAVIRRSGGEITLSDANPGLKVTIELPLLVESI